MNEMQSMTEWLCVISQQSFSVLFCYFYALFPFKMNPSFGTLSFPIHIYQVLFDDCVIAVSLCCLDCHRYHIQCCCMISNKLAPAMSPNIRKPKYDLYYCCKLYNAGCIVRLMKFHTKQCNCVSGKNINFDYSNYSYSLTFLCSDNRITTIYVEAFLNDFFNCKAKKIHSKWIILVYHVKYTYLYIHRLICYKWENLF